MQVTVANLLHKKLRTGNDIPIPGQNFINYNKIIIIK